MSENIERARAFLRIWLTPGLGLRAAHRLVDEIGDPRSLDLLSEKDLRGLGLETDAARHLASTASGDRAHEEWERAAALGIRIVDLSHPEYPELLGETPDPPLVLYVRGDGWRPDRPHIAVVGSRRPTSYGVNCAERIAHDLAQREVVVVSGLARGIDAAAHRGALAAGSTVAVMGTGADRIYPVENRSLAEDALRGGALVSELPLGALPLPQNFPRRNRILAGMTLGTVVVEAAERSGSLITARLALEANREVFAVPGPVYSSSSRGPHQLIQQGACLVTGWEDIARALSPKIRMVEPHATRETDALTAAGRRLLESLSFSEEVSIDALLSKTDAPASEVYSTILALELEGLVRRIAGDRYVRNHRS